MFYGFNNNYLFVFFLLTLFMAQIMFYGSDRYKKLPSCVHKIGLFHNP
jgi:hypothetical protein